MNFSLPEILMIIFLVLGIFTTTEKKVTMIDPPPPQQHSPVYAHPQYLHQDQPLPLLTSFILLFTLILCWRDSLITNHQAGKD